jgi:hypothetical protein
MMRKLFGLAAVAALGACSMGQDTAAAEAAVAQFHQMLDAGRFHEIYAATDTAFRNATPEEELTRVLAAVHERLGAVRQANRQGWHVNYNNGTTSVELNYNTTFATAPGTERFVYRIDHGTAALVSYDVHSDALRSAGATANSDGGQGDSSQAEPGQEDAGQGDTGGK